MNLTRAAKMSFPVLVCFLVSFKTVHAQSLKVPYVSVSPTNGPLWIAQEARLFTNIIYRMFSSSISPAAQ
jgi:hypothetical protein